LNCGDRVKIYIFCLIILLRLTAFSPAHAQEVTQRVEYSHGSREPDQPAPGPNPKENSTPRDKAERDTQKAEAAVGRTDSTVGRGELKANETPAARAEREKRKEEYAAAARYKRNQEDNKKSFNGNISSAFKKAATIQVEHQKKLVLEYAVSAFNEWNKENYIEANKIARTAATITDAYLGTLPLGHGVRADSFEEQLRNVSVKGLNSAPGKPKELGDYVMAASIVDHVTGNEKDAEAELGAASSLYDIGLSVYPFTSVPKDLYEFISGKGLVSGRDLSDWERTFCLVGVLTVGALEEARAGYKLTKLGVKLFGKTQLLRRLSVPFEMAIEKIVIRSASEVNTLTKLANPKYTEDSWKLGTKAVDLVAPATTKPGTFVRVL
jgi:hypothetical protein